MRTNRMINHLRLLALTLSIVLIGACAPAPQVPLMTETSQPVLTQTPSQIASLVPSATTIPATPTPVPTVQVPASDQVVLTITNPQPFSGREGDPRPDWLGWGTELFAVASDGSFWLADTAIFPNRLLHYNPQGELLQQVSLADVVVYAQSLAIARDSLWVLDSTSQQPKVIQFNLDGKYKSSVDLDTSGVRFYYGLMSCDRSDLLTLGSDGYTEVIADSGEVTRQILQELSCYGHTYHHGSWNAAPVIIDGISSAPFADFRVGSFLGFNPDGSFAISGYLVDASGMPDYQQSEVRYYDVSGKLLGLTRQKPMNIYKQWDHQLAFGPDGSVYQLLSNPDHSVQILRLGFSASLAPLSTVPTVTLTPLNTLTPSGPATTGEEQARHALVAFFSNLSAGNYAEVASFFGGEEGIMPTQASGETPDDYWSNICVQFRCLQVAEITAVQQASSNQYTFYTVFVNPDGSRFEQGTCCGGDPAAYPPVWQFAYPVQKIDGVWKVMRGPVYTP